MPTEIQAVKCAYCGKLHPKTGEYINIVEIDIREHKNEDEGSSYEYKKRAPQSVVQKDIIVCNNACLSDFISLKKGF